MPQDAAQSLEENDPEPNSMSTPPSGTPAASCTARAFRIAVSLRVG
jgi:hypothetical protein